jgi:hypothetical protein
MQLGHNAFWFTLRVCYADYVSRRQLLIRLHEVNCICQSCDNLVSGTRQVRSESRVYYLSPRLVGTKITSTSPTRLSAIVIRYKGDMLEVSHVVHWTLRCRFSVEGRT